MIKAIIVDDEQHCIERLLELLSQYCKYSVAIAGCFSSVEDALEGIKQCEPELVFLDVEINDHTGFELLQRIGKINFDVIFTTAHNQYAVQAFKFSAIDYLLKPVDPDDLLQAVEKCKGKIQQNSLYTLSLYDALPIIGRASCRERVYAVCHRHRRRAFRRRARSRREPVRQHLSDRCDDRADLRRVDRVVLELACDLFRQRADRSSDPGTGVAARAARCAARACNKGADGRERHGVAVRWPAGRDAGRELPR